jgi:hypothetical protein
VAGDAALAVAIGPSAQQAAKKKKKKHKKKCTRYKTVRVKKKGKVKKVRRCVSHKKKCKRYKTVRVKRKGHWKKVRRCAKPKKKPAATNPAPGGGANSGPVTMPLVYGMNSVTMDDGTLSNVAGAGVSMTRRPMHWGDIESSPGHFNWSQYDNEYIPEARHGLTVMPVIVDDPSWAAPSEFTIPSNPAAYADFAAQVAARYGPGGSFWATHPTVPYHPTLAIETWNEPYWYSFNDSGADPGTYARLVKAAGAAIHAANPQVKVLLAADLTGYVSDSKQVEWVNTMYSAVPDLNSYFDGVAVHPYSWPDAPDVYDGPGDRWAFKRIGDIRAKFVAHGAANKGFWITEVGYPTCSGSNRCVSEAAQASDLARIFQLVKTDYAGFMQAIFIYNYKDPSGAGSSDPEGWFGLLRSNGSAKPAWNVLRQATGAG